MYTHDTSKVITRSHKSLRIPTLGTSTDCSH